MNEPILEQSGEFIGEIVYCHVCHLVPYVKSSGGRFGVTGNWLLKMSEKELLVNCLQRPTTYQHALADLLLHAPSLLIMESEVCCHKCSLLSCYWMLKLYLMLELDAKAIVLVEAAFPCWR